MGIGNKEASNWSILVVDDEFAVRESLRMILKRYYEISTASDGEEALKIIKERKFNLITLDLNMPNLSGMETLREIRKINNEVHIVIITGYGTREEEKEARLLGVKEFISKPFSIDKLMHAIEGLRDNQVESCQ